MKLFGVVQSMIQSTAFLGQDLNNIDDIMNYMLDNFNKIKMFNHDLISKYIQQQIM